VIEVLRGQNSKKILYFQFEKGLRARARSSKNIEIGIDKRLKI
jgi:hypothetical protein